MSQLRYSSLVLVAGMVAIYLLELLVPGIADMFSFVAADFTRAPWTIVTSIFLHSPGDYMHLLNNMFFLAVFGFMLENIVGTRRFLALFLGTGIVANLSAFTFYPTSQVLGASGAVSGIVAALAAIRPRTVGLLWGVPVPMWVAFLGWVFLNWAGLGGGGNVAFAAHLYGLGAGLLAGIYLRRDHAPEPDEEDDLDIDIEAWEERYMR